MNRARRLPRELLKHDRAHERIVVRPGAPRLEPTGSDAVDDPAEDRIDGFEVRDRCSVLGAGHGLGGKACRTRYSRAYLARYFATFFRSATNCASASARTSLGARRIELGCTVANPASASSVLITFPCCTVTRIAGPNTAFAAVAPSATMTRGFTTAISSSSHG